MLDRFDGDPLVGQPPRPRSTMRRGSRTVLILSIPVFLGLSWLIASWLPRYAAFGLVPAVFALHSIALLIRGTEP
jgi:hypothetical protein